MSIADELAKLQDLYRRNALSEEEYAAAKAAVSDDDSPSTGADPAMHAHLEEMQFQNDVARLDREWELERENYMVAGRYGGRHIPSAGVSILGGVFVGAFGIFWTIMASSMGAPVFFPIFGVLFVLFGIGMSIYSVTKATGYRAAHEQYRARRAKLLGGKTDSSSPSKP